MASSEVQDHIRRSPQDVYAYLRDLNHLPEWSGFVLEAQNVRHPTVDREGQYTAVGKFLGRRYELPFRAVVTEDPFTLLLETTGGPIPHSWRYTVTPRGEGTDLKVVMEGDPGTFFKLAAPIVLKVVQRQMQTDMLALKELLEAQAQEQATAQGTLSR